MIAIDLFAGLGGSTEGARLAGVPVRLAANHSPLAVEWHERNHPGVAHWTQDLQQADFSRAPSHDLPRRPSFVGGKTDATDYAWMVWRLHAVPQVRILRLEDCR